MLQVLRKIEHTGICWWLESGEQQREVRGTAERRHNDVSCLLRYPRSPASCLLFCSIQQDMNYDNANKKTGIQ